MTTIINNRPNVYSVGPVRLMPGPNEVADKDAKKFLDHKSVKERIKIGHLTVDGKAPAAEKAAAEKAAAEKAAAEKAAAEKAAAEKAAADAKAPTMPKGDDK